MSFKNPKFNSNSIVRVIFLLFLSISLTFCSSDSEIEMYSNTSFEDKTTIITYSQIESEIFRLVNNYREVNSLSRLKTLNEISEVAENHTNYMIQTGEVSHDNFPNRVLKLIKDANAKSVSENVAFGFSSAQGVFNSWLKSPAHKKIIDIASHTHFGISTKTDSNGRNYFTQIFVEI